MAWPITRSGLLAWRLSLRLVIDQHQPAEGVRALNAVLWPTETVRLAIHEAALLQGVPSAHEQYPVWYAGATVWTCAGSGSPCC